ncbi:hypothetical protein SAMN05660880_00312 [Luteibacter sp. 22Crub2.1]|nr:hypothetical protein [Luteibacter sp. 22Crub2.1]SKB27943.1 hypothetical protein SAMN05660880_00312 [Luteibacter sp. 22Crub2.1]
MAQVHAYALSARYAALFDQARRLKGMKQLAPNDAFLLDVDDPGHPLHIEPWKLEHTRTGFTLATENNSDEEHAQAVEVLRVLMGNQAMAVSPSMVGAPIDRKAECCAPWQASRLAKPHGNIC